MEAILELPYATRLAGLAPALLLAAFWLSGCRGLRPGMPRAAAAAPVVLLHCAAPWLLFRRVPPHGPAGPGEPHPDILALVLLEFASVWLTNFKVGPSSVHWAALGWVIALWGWKELPALAAWPPLAPTPPACPGAGLGDGPRPAAPPLEPGSVYCGDADAAEPLGRRGWLAGGAGAGWAARLRLGQGNGVHPILA